MKVSIVLRGQVAHKAGCAEAGLELEAGMTVQEALAQFACGLPPDAASYFDDATLFVAVDGQHVPDRSVPLAEGAREILVMSPMAGG